MKSISSRRLTFWAVALIALALAGMAVAQEPEPIEDAVAEDAVVEDAAAAIDSQEDGNSTETEPPAAMPVSSVRIEIDPETGQAVVPPPAKRRQMVLTPDMQNALNQSSEGLNKVVLPNGVSYVNLQGRFLNLAFATVGKDGTVKIDHDLPETAEPATDEAADDEVAQ